MSAMSGRCGASSPPARRLLAKTFGVACAWPACQVGATSKRQRRNSPRAWGSAPGFVEQKTASAESAIHFWQRFVPEPRQTGRRRRRYIRRLSRVANALRSRRGDRFTLHSLDRLPACPPPAHEDFRSSLCLAGLSGSSLSKDRSFSEGGSQKGGSSTGSATPEFNILE
jgi:hypothetical protein